MPKTKYRYTDLDFHQAGDHDPEADSSKRDLHCGKEWEGLKALREFDKQLVVDGLTHIGNDLQIPMLDEQ